MSRSVLRIMGVTALAVCLGALAPGAGARSSATVYTLDVTFSPTGTIAVTLPDGTPVGTTSGAPTQVPGGYYTLQLSGPGACTQLPLFELKGPGVDIFNDMTAGEVDTMSLNAFLRPSSSYTWKNYSTPGVAYNLVTSSDPVGAAPVAVSPTANAPHADASSSSVIGSGIVAFRGTLAATVAKSGQVTLSYKGKHVTKLVAGRYTLTVVDGSAATGLSVGHASHGTTTVTGAAFVGKRSTSLDLTQGVWSLKSGGKTVMLTVG